MSDGSILETGKRIVQEQEDDTFVVGVTREGAEASVKKNLGRGWSLWAWVRKMWTGDTAAGAGVTKKL